MEIEMAELPAKSALRRVTLSILPWLAGLILLFVALHLAPNATHWVLDWLAIGATIVGGVAIAVVMLMALPLLKSLGVAILEHFGWPNVYFRSRRNPPWKFPRQISSSGLASRQDRADYDVLLQRLNLVPSDPLLDEADYLAPRTYQDKFTGQFWRQERFEMGLSQWETLRPIAKPTDA